MDTHIHSRTLPAPHTNMHINHPPTHTNTHVHVYTHTGARIVSEALPFVQDQRWSDSQLDRAAFMLLINVITAGLNGIAHSLVLNIIDSQFVPLFRKEPVRLKPIFEMNGMSCDQVIDR